MTTEHVKTRRKLRKIADINEFNQLLGRCVLSDDEKALLKLHYINRKDFRYIGDVLGYAEVTIKTKHRKALRKISNIL